VVGSPNAIARLRHLLLLAASPPEREYVVRRTTNLNEELTPGAADIEAGADAGAAAPARKAKAPAKPKSVKVKAADSTEAPVVDLADVAPAESAPVVTEAPVAAPAAAPTPRVWTGPEPTTMEELLAGAGMPIKNLKQGDVLDGIVVRVDKDEVLVDIGAKSEGVVSSRELHGRNGEEGPALTVGDTVLVYVMQPESEDGHVVLSIRRAGMERKWRTMQEQLDAGTIIEAAVIDHNKGGLIVDCGIRGFVPISQIVDFPRRPAGDAPRDAIQEIAEKLQPYVGRKLRMKILEVNRKGNRLILSEKVAHYEERRGKRDELFSTLSVGQRVAGVVRSIAPFGLFVDLGGIDGLIHKSEISWSKVANPEAGYNVGDSVDAEVIDINTERGRISLSIRKLQPDPWNAAIADIKIGDFVEGTITKLVNFGAFVRVRDGLEGLIHISELSHNRVTHPGDVVKDEQTLKLKVISLDSERHRLGLSLKQAEETPVRETPAAEPKRETRRARPERSFSMDDAVQEPEGGIDTTLAAAFAGIREKIAETADDAAGSDGETKKKRAPKKADDGESATEAIEEALADAAPEAPADQA
jgi:small subunit ribosomal protein S1